jgi:hypothetical protein
MTSPTTVSYARTAGKEATMILIDIDMPFGCVICQFYDEYDDLSYDGDDNEVARTVRFCRASIDPDDSLRYRELALVMVRPDGSGRMKRPDWCPLSDLLERVKAARKARARPSGRGGKIGR